MDVILTLEGIGLISALRVDNEIEVSDEGADGFFNGSDLMILFESSNEQFNTFRYRSYPLSEVGKQLLPIVQEESNDDYLIDLGNQDCNRKGRIVAAFSVRVSYSVLFQFCSAFHAEGATGFYCSATFCAKCTGLCSSWLRRYRSLKAVCQITGLRRTFLTSFRKLVSHCIRCFINTPPQ